MGTAQTNDTFRRTLDTVTGIKPLENILRLQEALMPGATRRPPGGKADVMAENGLLYILLSGHYWVYRKEDNLKLFTAKAPHIYGLAEMLLPAGSTTGVMFSPGCDIFTIPTDSAQKILNATPALWKDAAALLAFHLHFSYWRDLHLLNDQAYDSIRGKLMELEANTTAFRENISVLNYILSTSKLSRSTVMRILRDLKEGGYITTNRGKLISINYLPLRY